MAFTQADVDKLEAALSQPYKRIRFSDGRENEYRSVKEVLEALTVARAEVAAANSGSKRPLCTVATFVKD